MIWTRFLLGNSYWRNKWNSSLCRKVIFHNVLGSNEITTPGSERLVFWKFPLGFSDFILSLAHIYLVIYKGIWRCWIFDNGYFYGLAIYNKVFSLINRKIFYMDAHFTLVNFNCWYGFHFSKVHLTKFCKCNCSWNN